MRLSRNTFLSWVRGKANGTPVFATPSGGLVDEFGSPVSGGGSGAGAWSPALDGLTAAHFSARGLGSGAVSAWASQVPDGSVMAQATAGAQPVANGTAVVFDGTDDALTRANAGAALVRTVLLPEGAAGSEAGRGFTCTGGGFDDSDGTYWEGNHGLRTESDAALQQPSVVQLRMDRTTGELTLLREILLRPLGWTGSVQGVAVTPTTLWVNDAAAGNYKEISKATGALTGRTITTTWGGAGCAYDSSDDGLWCNQRAQSGSGLEKRSCSTGAAIVASTNTGLSEQDSMWYQPSTKTLLMSYGSNGAPGLIRVFDCSGAAPRNIGAIVLDMNSDAVEGIVWDGGTTLHVFSDGYYHNGTVNRLNTYRIAPIASDVIDLFGVWSIPATSGTDAIITIGEPLQSAGIGAGIWTTGPGNISIYGQSGESAATSRATLSVTVDSQLRDRIVYARLDRTNQLISVWVDGKLAGSGAATVWTRPFFNTVPTHLGRAVDAGRLLNGAVADAGWYMGAGPRERIEGYLAHANGLQAQLPLTHPYRWTAP